jgi:GR25 family glycosyltransferase involved in LPS biosynthesis
MCRNYVFDLHEAQRQLAKAMADAKRNEVDPEIVDAMNNHGQDEPEHHLYDESIDEEDDIEPFDHVT